jgi:hypothetical protein
MDFRNAGAVESISGKYMRRPLTSLLVALLVITCGAAPVCAVNCAAKRATADHPANLSGPPHEHHHHGSTPMDKGQNSPKGHRHCGGDLHYGSLMTMAAAKVSAVLLGSPTAVTAWTGGHPFPLEAGTFTDILLREYAVLPSFGTALSPLRL